jgi:hypothetical protein
MLSIASSYGGAYGDSNLLKLQTVHPTVRFAITDPFPAEE